MVVIGGGAAGMSAASAARRVAPERPVIVCEAGEYAAYGMCGIPYYLGGIVDRAETLLAYPPEVFRDRRGIDLRLGTTVRELDTAARRVTVANDGGAETLDYDTLVLAAGADPVVPPIAGIDHPRVFTVRSLASAAKLRTLLDSGSVRKAIVVGAGYIGLETAEALVAAGAAVRIVEALPRVLSTVDEPIAEVVDAEVRRHADLQLGSRLDAILDGATGPVAVVDGAEFAVDLIVLAVGVRPATGLLAGAEKLPNGAVVVDEGMRTSLPGVFAAGDCVALPHLVLGAPAWVPLGPAANKTGRVAGTVAAGGRASFRGVVGTAVVKVFDLEVARTGLSLAEATAAGIPAVATDVESRSRAKYYPGAAPLHVRLVHTPDGRLLGAQLAGREGAAKRIDVVATALHAELSVDDLGALDLAYAPPFAPVYDPVLVAAGRANRSEGART
ncbi:MULTISPECIES: FAD-dependent oxidoreductase [Amycolatopsis]|nr:MULTISPECIES: FAD-dependent oxidoreductase [Amycolatopsis]MBB2505432.1 FAD-dependent oxidoreductase [Amycolatopsis echigonensis]WIV60799.1 FAD-dependent oxidoreductase [Amycolatopsis sp. 2-2]